MLTKEEINFILENKGSNTTKLLLSKSKLQANLNISLCVKCIEARNKVEKKIPLWYKCNSIAYTHPLSVEQCSSQLTAEYKQHLIKEVCATSTNDDEDGKTPKQINTVDFTGGMGVDSFFISQIANNHYYIERNSELCQTTEYNFAQLDAKNITVINKEISIKQKELFNSLATKNISLIYIDPARRSKTNSKIVSIKEYEPNILELLEPLFFISRYILVKVSPMEDIKLNLSLLPQTKEIHIVAVDNECKELLFLLERDYQKSEYKNREVILKEGEQNSTIIRESESENEVKITAINLSSKVTSHKTSHECSNAELHKHFSFTLPQENNAVATYTNELGSYLYEPSKALLKSGAYKLASSHYNIDKLAPSTHLYTSNELKTEFLGKIYTIKEVIEFNKKNIKAVAKQYPNADITARNFPLDTNALKKLSGIKDGGFNHIFATTLTSGKRVVIVTEREKNS